MDYAAAIEEKSNPQANHIINLEASVDGQTVLANTTEYVASVMATASAYGNSYDRVCASLC